MVAHSFINISYASTTCQAPGWALGPRGGKAIGSITLKAMEAVWRARVYLIQGSILVQGLMICLPEKVTAKLRT